MGYEICSWTVTAEQVTLGYEIYLETFNYGDVSPSLRKELLSIGAEIGKPPKSLYMATANI